MTYFQGTLEVLSPFGVTEYNFGVEKKRRMGDQTSNSIGCLFLFLFLHFRKRQPLSRKGTSD